MFDDDDLPPQLPVRHLMARDLPFAPFAIKTEWPRRRIPSSLQDLRTEEDVRLYREFNNVPEDATCPRWIDCACKYTKAQKGESTERCGGVQVAWNGPQTFCRNCGGAM